MTAPRPAKCFGPEEHKHRAGCRKGRPRCRWRRVRPCCCAAYHYPHRPKSGACKYGVPAVLLPGLKKCGTLADFVSPEALEAAEKAVTRKRREPPKVKVVLPAIADDASRCSVCGDVLPESCRFETCDKHGRGAFVDAVLGPALAAPTPVHEAEAPAPLVPSSAAAEAVSVAPSASPDLAARRSAAARKAWETIRRRRAEASV